MLGQVDTPEWMTFTTIALVGIVLYTVVNLISFVRAKDWNGVLKIVLSFVGGFLVVLLMANAELTENLRPVTDGPTVGDMDFASLLMLGIGFGSIAPALADARKAFDGSDSAAKPPLVDGASPPS